MEKHLTDEEWVKLMQILIMLHENVAKGKMHQSVLTTKRVTNLHTSPIFH